MSKVSVIIPTYNRALFLHDAITSVLKQTYQDFEILVIDDCSKDNTQEIVSSFHDKRIRYIRHEANKGEAGSRNTGIRNSNAEYVAFLDDDDEWLPEKLKLQVDLIKNSPPEVGGVYTSYVQVDRTKKKILWQWIPKKRGNIYHDMFIKNYVGTPSTVILKRECFESVGLFDESLTYATDYDMWIRISKEFHFEYIDESLVKYCIHENRLSANLETRIIGIETILKRYDQLFALNSKSYCRYYSYLGILYYYYGNIKKSKEAFLKAIRLYPFDIRNYFYLGLSSLSTNTFKRIKKIMKKLSMQPRSQDIF